MKNLVAHKKIGPYHCTYMKAQYSPELHALCIDPDSFIDNPHAKILKNDATSTVALTYLDQQAIIIKRYNIKSISYAIKRAFFPTRAAASWRNAHRLMATKIPTAMPIAKIEKRFSLFRSTSYFICVNLQGEELLQYVKTHSADEIRHIAQEMKLLLQQLQQHRCSHGDLKATNIIVVDHKPFLIDLDAMHWHKLSIRWKRAQCKDIWRFHYNWRHDPALKEYFLSPWNYAT